MLSASDPAVQVVAVAPVTVQAVTAPDMSDEVDLWTKKDVIALPPLLVGTVQVMMLCLTPLAADGEVGASGVVLGVVFTVPLLALLPAALVANALK